MRSLQKLLIIIFIITCLTAFCACGNSNNAPSNNKTISLLEAYNISVKEGYDGSFADFFKAYNNVKDFKEVDGDLIAFFDNGTSINLGVISAPIDEDDGVLTNVDNDDCYFHLSFDDTMVSLKNLTSSAQYNSIFEEPFFAYLKQLHDTYGAKISLYTYLDVICNMSDKYQKELGEASQWLKFGLHSTSHSKRFNTATYEDGYNAWTTFVKDVYRITGTFQSIDRMPRLHYWEGTKEALCGMRDALCGPIGFLTSEHEWPSYYLTNGQHLYIYNRDHLIDYTTGLIFLSTDMRIDWFMENYSSTNVYRKPIKDNIYDELSYRFNSVNYASTLASYIVFGHEWMYYDGERLSDESKVWLDDICRYAFEHNIPFDFPQHRSYYPTPMDIH